MAGRIKRPCRGGCGAVVVSGWCEACSSRVGSKRAERNRESSSQRGYGWKWQKTSNARLVKHLWCVDPYKVHELQEPATLTDHIIPVTGPRDPRFWDSKNWQSLCDSCHGRKTASEDGGFGHASSGRA